METAKQKVTDVTINDVTLISVNSTVANLAADGSYNSSTNKLATQDTVKNYIDEAVLLVINGEY